MQDKKVKYIPYTSTRFLVSKYQYIFGQFLLDLFVFNWRPAQEKRAESQKNCDKNLGKNRSWEAIFQRKGPGKFDN